MRNIENRKSGTIIFRGVICMEHIVVAGQEASNLSRKQARLHQCRLPALVCVRNILEPKLISTCCRVDVKTQSKLARFMKRTNAYFCRIVLLSLCL